MNAFAGREKPADGYQRTVTAALNETHSKFGLAGALALDIPQRLGRTARDEVGTEQQLAEAQARIITAGGEPRAVATLRNYRLTALWVMDPESGAFRWVPGRSWSVHVEAQQRGLSYARFAALPEAGVYVRRASGIPGIAFRSAESGPLRLQPPVQDPSPVPVPGKEGSGPAAPFLPSPAPVPQVLARPSLLVPGPAAPLPPPPPPEQAPQVPVSPARPDPAAGCSFPPESRPALAQRPDLITLARRMHRYAMQVSDEVARRRVPDSERIMLLGEIATVSGILDQVRKSLRAAVPAGTPT